MRERVLLIYGLFSLCLPLAASANELPKVNGQVVRIELPGDGRTLSPAKVASTEGNAFPGKKTDFHGFDCYEFRTKTGVGVKVVCPEKTAPGKPWLWRSLFWEAIPAFYNADLKLVDEGYHVVLVHGDVAGHPSGNKNIDAAYELLTTEYGFAKKCSMASMSRGTLSLFRWATMNPEKVESIYVDNGVCNVLSWPAGYNVPGNKTISNGDAGSWADFKKKFGYATDAEALLTKESPIDLLEPLAQAGVPILMVCGSKDTAVPYAENDAIMEERYKKLGGSIQVIIEDKGHSHGMQDPTPVLEFIRSRGLSIKDAPNQQDTELPAPIVAKPVADNSPRIWGKKIDADWVESLTERGHPLDAGITGSKKADSLKYIGMPAGGIGCGSVYMGGDGQLWVWDIFNQMHEGIVSHNAALPPELEAIVGRPRMLTERHGANYVAPPTPEAFPNAFEQGFGVCVDGDFRRFEAKDWSDVEFEGNWPVGTVRYSDPDMPVEVTLNGYSPFIPLNVKDSSLPVTVMEFTLKNTSEKSVEANVSGWLENAASIHTRKLMPVALTTKRTEEAGMKLLTHASSATPESLVEAKRPDIVFETFEGAGYGRWKIEGKAFAKAPAKKDTVSKYMKVQGESMALSSDVETGTLTSPPFVIQRKTIQFFLAGGKKPGSLCLNLLVDPSSSGDFDATRAKIVASEAGLNRGALAQCSFNVSLLQGKKAQIQIVDNERGKEIRGYVAVDQIVFADGQDDQVVIKEALDYGTISLGALSADAKATDHEGFPGWGNGLQLAPGESKTVTFMLTWNFPNIYEIPGMKQQTHEYASRFADSAAVAEYVAGQYPRLSGDTHKWVETWYDGSLPAWFLDRTLLTADTLQTANVYLFENGQFWGWEGIGSCAGTCTHVYQYAQAFSRIFPSLERSVREGWNYTNQHEDGVMGHRSWDHLLAVDGQAGVVLSTYREHLMSADNAFLRRVWPNTKRALEVLIRLDAKDGKDDGIIEEEQHNTLDAAWAGPVAWISGEYQAALRATEEMALIMGDEAFAKQCRVLYESGRGYIVRNLYDGEYFFNIPDPDKPVRGNSVKGCHIDQVYGQGWAFQVGLGRTLPAKEVRSALNAIWKYNYVEDVGEFRKANRGGRWYAMPGESGLVMCTFPRDEKPRQGAYLAENMTGFEYQVAGHMLYEGTPELIGKGLAITRAIHDRYSAPKRNPYNEIECSDHYARAAASYGAFLGACGFQYNGPKGEIGFAPRLTPDDFRAAFTAAEGWGSFAQKVVNGRQSAEIDLRYGTLELKQLSVGQVEGTKASGVVVKLDGKSVAAKFSREDGAYLVRFDTTMRLKAGQCLEVLF